MSELRWCESHPDRQKIFDIFKSAFTNRSDEEIKYFVDELYAVEEKNEGRAEADHRQLLAHGEED
jgi:hypothetical protein